MKNFVLTNRNEILVQIEDEKSEFGFYLADEEMSYDGGFGSGATTWQVIEKDDPRITDELHERLDWLLEDE